jgi:hypothetical protein
VSFTPALDINDKKEKKLQNRGGQRYLPIEGHACLIRNCFKDDSASLTAGIHNNSENCFDNNRINNIRVRASRRAR